MDNVEKIIKLSELGYSREEINTLLSGGAIDVNNGTVNKESDGAKPSEGEKPSEGKAPETPEKKETPTTPSIDFSKVEELKTSIDALKATIQESNRNGTTVDAGVTEKTESVSEILNKMFK